MKFLKAKFSTIFLSLFELIVGILLLISPVGFTTGIFMTAGIILMAVGLLSAIRYFRTNAAEASSGQMMFKALVCLIVGAFCLFRSGWIIATFPLLTMIYGVVILLTGLAKIQWTIDGIRLKKKRWYIGAIGAAVSALCAVVIFLNPFSSTAVLWIFTGVSLIVEAVMDIALMIVSSLVKKGDE